MVNIPTDAQGMRWEQALLLCRTGPGYYPDIASIHSLEDNCKQAFNHYYDLLFVTFTLLLCSESDTMLADFNKPKT